MPIAAPAIRPAVSLGPASAEDLAVRDVVGE